MNRNEIKVICGEEFVQNKDMGTVYRNLYTFVYEKMTSVIPMFSWNAKWEISVLRILLCTFMF